MVVAAILGTANIQLKYGILNMSGAATSAAVATLSPLQAALVGLAGQGYRAWDRRRYGWIPANTGSGLWGAAGASIRYACVSHGIPVQGAIAIALLTGIAINIAYTSVSLSFLTSVPALQMVRQILTPALLGAYAYFLIAAGLASTMLGHSYDGLIRASGLFALAIAIGDSVGGRSIRAFLERQLADVEPHVQYSRLAQGTFHDLRNHVNAAIANLADIDREQLRPDDATAIAAALDSLEDAQRALQSAQATGRASSLTEFTRVDLAELCRHITMLHRRVATSRHVSLMAETPDSEVPAFGNAVLLGEVLSNLILNALDACAANGSVVVHCRSLQSGQEIAVTDTGAGITDTISDRIFEPGFTTKGPAGSGLGLYTALGIARQHRGDLRFMSGPGGRGATFILSLPNYVSSQRRTAAP